MSENIKLTSEKILEINSDSDVMKIKFISTKARPNLNNCHFTSDFLKARAKDLVHPNPMPLTIDYDEYNNMPKGHGVNAYGELMAMPVGFMTQSYVETDEHGVEQLINEAVIWKNRFPSITNCIYDLHLKDQLRFSIECIVSDYDFTDDGIRVPKIEGAKFCGVAIVENPAEPSAKSLMVASLEDLNSDDNSDLNNINNSATSGGVQMEEKVLELESTITDLNKVVEEKDTEIASLKEELEKLQTEIAELKAVETEVEQKNEAIISLNNAIEGLKEEIASLSPVREEYERLQQEARDKEMAEKQNALTEYVLNSKLVTKEEIESNEELKNAIQELNERFVKDLLADRAVEKAKSLEVNEKQNDDVTIHINSNGDDLLPETVLTKYGINN